MVSYLVFEDLWGFFSPHNWSLFHLHYSSYLCSSEQLRGSESSAGLKPRHQITSYKDDPVMFLSLVLLGLYQLLSLTSTISSWLCDHLVKKYMGYHIQGHLDLTTVSRVYVWDVKVSPNAYLHFLWPNIKAAIATFSLLSRSGRSPSTI